MFKLRIITPKGLYFESEISSLTIKMSTGYRTILSGHEPLVGSLDYAPMHIIKNNKTYYYAISGGIINVKKNEVVIVSSSVERSKDIDINRAIASKERAEQRLKEKNDSIDVKRAELSLLRALSRIDTYNSDKNN